jgi:hypothetical protein
MVRAFCAPRSMLPLAAAKMMRPRVSLCGCSNLGWHIHNGRSETGDHQEWNPDGVIDRVRATLTIRKCAELFAWLLAARGPAVAGRIDGRALFFHFGWADRSNRRPVRPRDRLVAPAARRARGERSGRSGISLSRVTRANIKAGSSSPVADERGSGRRIIRAWLIVALVAIAGA